MTRWRAVALGLVLFGIVAGANAQKIPVEISHSGTDNVGRQFVYGFKDALRGSNTFRLLEANETQARIVVQIVSTRSSTNENVSAIGITTTVDGNDFPVNGLYVTSSVRLLGDQMARSAAAEEPVDLDESVAYLRKKWPAVLKRLQMSTP